LDSKLSKNHESRIANHSSLLDRDHIVWCHFANWNASFGQLTIPLAVLPRQCRKQGVGKDPLQSANVHSALSPSSRNALAGAQL
jgi:hypothetical protein